jgi:hypothetical protein
VTAKTSKGKKAPKLSEKAKEARGVEKATNQKQDSGEESSKDVVSDKLRKTGSVANPEKKTKDSKSASSQKVLQKKQHPNPLIKWGIFVSVCLLSVTWAWWLPFFIPESEKWLPSHSRQKQEVFQKQQEPEFAPLRSQGGSWDTRQEDVSPQEKNLEPESTLSDDQATMLRSIEQEAQQELVAPMVEQNTENVASLSRVQKQLAPPVSQEDIFRPILKEYMLLQWAISREEPFAEALKALVRVAHIPPYLFSDLHQEVAFLGVPKFSRLVELLDDLIANPPSFQEPITSRSGTITEKAEKVLHSLFQMRKTNSESPKKQDIKGRLIQLRQLLLNQESWEVLEHEAKNLAADVEGYAAFEKLVAHIQGIRAGEEVIKIVDHFLLNERIKGRAETLSGEQASGAES